MIHDYLRHSKDVAGSQRYHICPSVQTKFQKCHGMLHFAWKMMKYGKNVLDLSLQITEVFRKYWTEVL